MCTLVASSHHASMCEGVNGPTWGHGDITFEKLCDMGNYSEYICEMNERQFNVLFLERHRAPMHAQV